MASPVEAEEVCRWRVGFYAQDYRQVITATALSLAIAPIIRLGAIAPQRKLQRVAIQHDKYLNAGLSGKGKETWMLLCFLRKLNLYLVCSITHTKTRIHFCIKYHASKQQTCLNKKRKREEY